jgi:hypothetical protein
LRRGPVRGWGPTIKHADRRLALSFAEQIENPQRLSNDETAARSSLAAAAPKR